MTQLHSFQDNSTGCYANVRMDNDDPVYISVAQTGVVVKKSKIGLFGPKLYDSQTVYDAAMTAKALDEIFPDYVTPDGPGRGGGRMANPVLRSFTNAALHCSTTAELTNILNTARERAGE